MFRRNPTPPPISGDDPLITADLPERVRTAKDRLAHQDDPALREAKSVAEIAADRAVAERIRAHHRDEQLAEVTAVEATAAQVRKATTAIVRADAKDLMLARRALADRRRQDSPHAQLAHLFRVKTWSGRGLAAVVVGAMIYSAVNVQHNLAPGGAGDPLFWASYGLEALISTVLVVFMVSGAAVARWGVTDGDTLIRWTEALLLAGSILLNTYPYLRGGEWFNVGAHGAAPVMVGVALVAHDAVSRRMGTAIARASATMPADDDTAERLAALGQVAAARYTTPSPASAVGEPTAPETGGAPAVSRAAAAGEMVEFEREFTPASRAEEPIARDEIEDDRATECATNPARETVDRAPIARDETAPVRATEDTAPIARESDAAREETPADTVPVAHTDATDDRAPRAAQSAADLDSERESIAAQSDQSGPGEEGETRERRAVVALVRGEEPARGERPAADRSSRGGRASIAREEVVDGSLARAADRAPRTVPIARGSESGGPFARELSRAEAMRLARAVADQGRSRQPLDVLTRIYLAHSQGHSPNHIGTLVGLPHSTVGRALAAATQVAGPRPI
ncbi:hypothetical protein BJY24_007878 [Nocardia transvalensis]|uniref:Uncharacterized protein n=1 Tax=Nocardia transvalensis TaxID=37333 RepID=A0A7W9UNK6_9NOCA|nr:hypothetical protein [Nocardia transvalensis]MBB5918945.1 hypothetical protein [Nocardia transvalensis]